MITRLDVADTAAVRCYERAFHRSFAGLTHNRLVRDLWIWDDEARRLRTRVPYDEQQVYVTLGPDGAVIAGLAANVRLATFQSATFGFALPRREGCCELLAVFAVAASLVDRLALWRQASAHLSRQGFLTAYGTSASRLVRFYRRLGGRVLETTVVRGEERVFWDLDLVAVANKRWGQAR